MFSSLLKLDKLNLVTDVPLRKSLYPQREIPRNYWACEHDVPHLLVKKKKKEKKRKEENTFFSYLPHLKSEKLYIFIIILIMVAEIYNLSKNSSLSEYAVVYSKLSKVWQFFFVDNVFIGSTFPLPDHKENMILKSSLLIKYLTRDPKHNFILG